MEILLAGVPAVRLIDVREGHTPEGLWPNASTPEDEEAARTQAAVTMGVFLLALRLMVAFRGGRLLEEEVILSFIQVCASSESGQQVESGFAIEWLANRISCTSNGPSTEESVQIHVTSGRPLRKH